MIAFRHWRPTVDERNTGFAVVVPWTRFLEIAEAENLLDRIEEVIKDRLKDSGYRPAGLVVSEKRDGPLASGENPTHREDFVGVLNKAAKPTKAE
jgi:hypothetical protein